MQLTKTISTKYMDDFCAYHGYKNKIVQINKDTGASTEITNPQTKEQFINMKFEDWFNKSVESYQINTAIDTARNAKRDSFIKPFPTV